MLKLKVANIQERIFLTFITLFIFFYRLGAYGLFDNNEGLYAEIAHEILLSGNFVIPTLNGAPYIEKPPLLYWLIAVSFKVFGVGEYSARMVPALAGFSTVWGVYFFMRRFKSTHAAFYSAVMLTTSIGFITFSHMIFFDVLLTCFLTFALLFYFEWWRTTEQKNLITFYIFMAAAVMTKGGVALVLVGTTLIAFWIVERRGWSWVFNSFNPLGILLFLVFVAPWHVMASFQDPNFLHFYFINEHVYRFLDIREPRDYYRGPWYYYLHRLALYLLPWLPFLGCRTSSNNNIEHRSLIRFLLCWMIVFLCFFSLSKAKANYYIVTLMPAIFLYFGLQLGSHSKDSLTGLKRFFALIAGGLFPFILSFSALIIWFFNFPYRVYMEEINLYYFVGTLGLLWIFYGIALVQCRNNIRVWIFTIALQSVVVWFYAHMVIVQYESRVSSKEIANTIPQNVDHIYFYKDYEKMSSIRFYLNRPVYVIDSLSNDLYYAKKYGLSPYFVTEEQWKKNADTPTCVFVFHEQKTQFEQKYPRFTSISRPFGKREIFSDRVFLYCTQLHSKAFEK